MQIPADDRWVSLNAYVTRNTLDSRKITSLLFYKFLARRMHRPVFVNRERLGALVPIGRLMRTNRLPLAVHLRALARLLVKGTT